MDDNKFWILFWSIVSLTIISFTGIIFSYCYFKNKLMIDNGYVYGPKTVNSQSQSTAVIETWSKEDK
jgi:type II secretory pathway component PulC